MEIVANKAVVLRTYDPNKITEVLPKSQVVKELDTPKGKGYEVAVKWTLTNTKILHNLGFTNTPSPIMGQYDWPGMYKPFEHQKTTAAFLSLHQRAFCLSDMGVGKTMSVIWAADYLMEKKYISRVLVICPLSIMDSAWRNDIFKTAMHRRVDVAHGSREKRLKVLESDAEFVIINYDGVESVRDEIVRSGFDLIVCDEATYLKTATTKRWKAVNSLISANTWLWLLTGTPAAQHPTDAYGLAKILNPKSVPNYFGLFRDKVMYKVTQFKYIPKPDAQDIIHKALQPAIRFTKEECLDLPEMLYTERDTPMTAQQKKYYDLLKKEMLIQAAGEEITAINAAIQMNKLLQIACIAYNTPVLTDSGWIPIQEVTAKHCVWDGEDWVRQGGALFRGVKDVAPCWGVDMTSDHLVLTTDGWVEAGEIANGESGKKFTRTDVRLPDSYQKSRYYTGHIDAMCDVVMPMHLRESSGAQEPIFTHKTQEASKTYDLINCGPRNRFVVLGKEGPLIVHNCGAAYSDTGEVIEFDCSHRLHEMTEVIKESSHKTLVFANFKHAIATIKRHLDKEGITNNTIHGGISAKKRTEIFDDFQKTDNVQVLIIQPQAASHGVTLHAANTIIWFGPVTSVETYLQANARVHRAGQNNPCMVVHLVGSDVERKLYAALQSKTLAQNSLLSMYKEAIGA